MRLPHLPILRYDNNKRIDGSITRHNPIYNTIFLIFVLAYCNLWGKGEGIEKWGFFMFLFIVVIKGIYNQLIFTYSMSNIENLNSQPIYHESLQARNERIRKNKNIRKEKIITKRNAAMLVESQSSDTRELTRDQRKQLQKEKNRLAAQISRDKQKKHLQDLQTKISEMQKLLKTNLCKRCHATLSDHSTSEEEPLEPLQHLEQTNSLNLQYQNTPSSFQLQVNMENTPMNSILNQEREYEELPFVRVDSRSQIEWGNIGKYFCVALLIIAVSLLSTTVESDSGSIVASRPVARILTANYQTCKKQYEIPALNDMHYSTNRSLINSVSNSPAMLSTIQKQKVQAWPFKKDSSQPSQICKNSFWQHYLKQILTPTTPTTNHNLLSCNNPNLLHITKLSEDSSSNTDDDKWTFLITNPTVSQIVLNGVGNYRTDQINYFDGVFQLTAQRVTFQKLLGGACLY